MTELKLITILFWSVFLVETVMDSKVMTKIGTSRSKNGETLDNLFIIIRFDKTNRINLNS